jgi:hypothetical protein
MFFSDAWGLSPLATALLSVVKAPEIVLFQDLGATKRDIEQNMVIQETSKLWTPFPIPKAVLNKETVFSSIRDDG